MSLPSLLAASLPPGGGSGSASVWIGGLVCLAIWIAYGWVMRKSADKLKVKLLGMTRSRRVFLGSGGLILALALLMGGMVLLALLGGADERGIKLWAWPIILVLGLVFVHLQVLGAAAMMTLVSEPGAMEPGKRKDVSAKGHEAKGETGQASSTSESKELLP